MEEKEVIDVTSLSSSDKAKLAALIREDNLEYVNQSIATVQIRESFYTKYGKRFLDILVSSIAIVLTAPINLVMGFVTFFDVGSPLIFKQQRIGKDERKFTIYKFRNMTNDRDVNGELLPPNERVTKWGKFVPKTSLDELLNFISIFNGDMSLVGPRPLLDSYVERFNKRDRQRYAVRPGLECPPYQHLDHAMTWNEKLDNDVWYVQNCSLKVDIVLIFRIIQLAFNRKATAVRSKAGAGGFLGYNRDGSVITTQNVPVKYCELFCEKFEYNAIEDAFQDQKNSKQTEKLKVGV